MRRRAFAELSASAAAAAALGIRPASAAPARGDTLREQTVADLRFGFAPLPAGAPGYDPAGDAKALIAAGTPSPAAEPVPGMQFTGSYAADNRFVIRVPQRWNGSLVVAGTAATRSEFANDAIWGDFALARGYAFASSNKGVPYNAIAEPAAAVTVPAAAYPIPFDAGGLEAKGLVLRFGMLAPNKVPIEKWNDDFRELTRYARQLLAERFSKPKRVYAVGLSNGGAQVRTLLERHPELADGGVDWSGVYWTPDFNFLDYFPVFLREMPAYVRSGFKDTAVVERLIKHGFPRDVTQADPAHPSLYADYYSNVPPFYNDLNVYVYALLIDPHATSSFGSPACVPNNENPKQLPGTCNGMGLAMPANRASYVPSPDARTAVKRFAHDGKLERPLVSIAGTRDALATPENNAVAYARAVARANRSAFHRLFLVENGTHVDTFVAFGYGLRPQLPFAWAAFERLIKIVENGDAAGAGAIRTVASPAEIA